MAEILDSGSRTEFQTGAVRDIQEGKGRCDLLPFEIIAELSTDATVRNTLKDIGYFMATGNKEFIEAAINGSFGYNSESQCNAFLELAVHFEDGCRKYGARNWEKGIPLSRYVDSGVRHFLKWARGDTDERHDRAFIWNMVCLLWTLEHRPEMNNLPFAKKGESDGQS